MNIEPLKEILLSSKPSEEISKNEDYVFSLIPELKKCKGFNQNNKWHIYDVYEHIMHVLDGVENNLVLRTVALFHDVGKPDSYFVDENGTGHFWGHWVKSQEIFLKFADDNNLEKEFTNKVSTLIYYHDVNLDVDDNELFEYVSKIGIDNISDLFKIKRADLKAQSQEYHYLLEKYDEIEKKIIKTIS